MKEALLSKKYVGVKATTAIYIHFIIASSVMLSLYKMYFTKNIKLCINCNKY